MTIFGYLNLPELERVTDKSRRQEHVYFYLALRWRSLPLALASCGQLRRCIAEHRSTVLQRHLCFMLLLLLLMLMPLLLLLLLLLLLHERFWSISQ